MSVRDPPDAYAIPAQLSVVVAAYNEAASIVATVESIRRQTAVELEILVADDGSLDGTVAALRRSFDLRPDPTLPGFRSPDGTLAVLTLPHQGKAAALNVAIAAARYPILVTVDADTLLAPLALVRLASAFEDPSVAAATGSVLVGNPKGHLSRFQQMEYVRNTMVRTAWASLGALEQLPGAFMAVRADWMRAVGGYPIGSLTEDYELVFRLYDRAARTGEPMRVVAIPTALATTAVPASLGPLLKQRARWFAGFLVTLTRFRHLIGQRRAGVLGLIKLPIKFIDAVHPPLALLSLLVLAADVRSLQLRQLAVSLFCFRWFWDSLTLTLAVRFARRAGAELSTGRSWPWIYVLLDGISYFWLRQLAVLRAYLWAVRPPLFWRSPSTSLAPVAAATMVATGQA